MPRIIYKQFAIDKNLAFVIQQVTKESTTDILGYLYGLASYMAEDAVKNSKAMRLNKKAVLMYKDSIVPFKLDISGRYGWRRDEEVPVFVTVSFPKETEYHNCETILNQLTEVGLGLSESVDDLPKFEKPRFFSPKSLKDIRIANEKRFITEEN